MKNGIIIIASVFAVALAVIVGNRLSNDAMTVIVGAFCGLMASVPFMIALVIALKQNWGAPAQTPMPRDDFAPRVFPAHYPQSPQPPVLIIHPASFGAQNFAPPSNQIYLPPNAPAEGAPREFKIIGEE